VILIIEQDLEDLVVFQAMRATRLRVDSLSFRCGGSIDDTVKILWFDTIYDELGELLELEGVMRPALRQGYPVLQKVRKDGTWRVSKGVPQRAYDGMAPRARGETTKPAISLPALSLAMQVKSKRQVVHPHYSVLLYPITNKLSDVPTATSTSLCCGAHVGVMQPRLYDSFGVQELRRGDQWAVQHRAPCRSCCQSQSSC
jgi:hypothetical protein